MLSADVIVVGGGPAGASCAAALAKKGFKVLVLEKQKFPRYKTCGGGITGRALKLVPTAALAAVEQECREATLNLSHINWSHSVRRTEPIISMTMRSVFDQLLLDEARRCGAIVAENSTFLNFKKSNGAYSVNTSGGEFSCRWIVAADGVQGTVAKKAGFANFESFRPAVEWELFVRPEILARYRGRAVFDLNFIPNGYAWIFPKGDHLSVGAGGTKATNLNRAVEAYLKQEGLGDFLRVEKHGYMIPGQIRPGALAKDGIFLIGDAAGMVDPLIDEGIYFGLLSGRLVADALANGANGAESRYMEMVRSQIIPRIKRGGALVGLVRVPRFLQRIIFARLGPYMCERMTEVITGEKEYPRVNPITAAAMMARRFVLGTPKNYHTQGAADSLKSSIYRALAQIVGGAIIVGTLHSWPWLLACVFLALLFFRTYVTRTEFAQAQVRAKIYCGMILAFVLGYSCEWVGTHAGWWTYHFYEQGFKVPPWVPIAWVIAFKVFFRLERKLMEQIPALREKKFFFLLALTVVLPPLGEIIAMSFGTWHYSFQPQFMGMPLQAVALISFVHLLNFYIVEHSPRLVLRD